MIAQAGVLEILDANKENVTTVFHEFLDKMVYFFVAKAVKSAMHRLGESKGVQERRIKYLAKTANFTLFTLLLIVVCMVLGLGYGEISVYLSSIFAVIGVALFAQWSLLSNITASVVIFFAFPYRFGERIKVTDPDFDLSGSVE